MARRATKEEIESVLAIVRDCVRNKRYTFIPRKKNLDALAAEGMTIPDLLDAIIDMKAIDYFYGPSEDRDRPGTGDIWEFGCQFRKEFYLKFKLVTSKDNAVVVLSFHEPDRTIHYPYRP
ncbi:MAG TPA: type II toxin-antitoxin system MqsR family toxin [Methylomusa anaerophila]|uniref:Uncharacterized protein n=1 Tax=Methylomusa anaerophila TaxID=1930071 RepID=A0A348AMM3_9FIRM|nr:type II toxin-antitoxin system MqsR family toxin [Methylomusa anaerophila]BBB92321.1 hypothetical protein MAMMFC1_03014 [Methylomusa anaerophila]HML90039.1 type II toxin-antitoxin system MqsR family toxin [Methylomusa anaerophila]